MRVVQSFLSESGAAFSTEIECLRDENAYLKKRLLNRNENNLPYQHTKNDGYIKLLEADVKKIREKVFDIPSTSGVYMYTNHADNDKKYIGSSVDIKNRCSWMFSSRANIYAGKAINEAFQNYPIEAWEVSILELCPIETLREKETKYINAYDTLNPEKGYNAVLPIMDDVHLEKSVKYRHLGVDAKYLSRAKQAVKEIGKVGMICEDIEAVAASIETEHKLRDGNVCFLPSCINKKCNVIHDSDVYLLPRCFDRLIGGYTLSIMTVIMGSDDTGWAFSYTCKPEITIPSFGQGFLTREDAIIGYLSSKVKKIHKLADEFKSGMDEELYSIFSKWTAEDLVKHALLKKSLTGFGKKVKFDTIINMPFEKLLDIAFPE